MKFNKLFKLTKICISFNFTADSAIEGMNGAEYFFDDVSQKYDYCSLLFLIICLTLSIL